MSGCSRVTPVGLVHGNDQNRDGSYGNAVVAGGDAKSNRPTRRTSDAEPVRRATAMFAEPATT